MEGTQKCGDVTTNRTQCSLFFDICFGGLIICGESIRGQDPGKLLISLLTGKQKELREVFFRIARPSFPVA